MPLKQQKILVQTPHLQLNLIQIAKVKLLNLIKFISQKQLASKPIQ